MRPQDYMPWIVSAAVLVGILLWKRRSAGSAAPTSVGFPSFPSFSPSSSADLFKQAWLKLRQEVQDEILAEQASAAHVQARDQLKGAVSGQPASPGVPAGEA